MKKQYSYFLLLMIFSYEICISQESWDLKQCVAYALANNISVKQQDIQVRLEKLTYHQSKLSQYPSANIFNSAGLNTGRSVDATTNQFTTQSIFYSSFNFQVSAEIFNFFSKRNTALANYYSMEASKVSLEKLENDISLNVVGAYLQALLNKQQVEINMIQVQQRTAQLTNVRKLVQAGMLPQLDAVQLEAQLSQDSANLIMARGAKEQALLYLKAMLNLDAATPFDVQAPAVDSISLDALSGLEPETIYQSALINLPEQQLNSLHLKSAEKMVKAAAGAMYPTISVRGNIQTGYSNAKNEAEPIGYTLKGYTKIGIVEHTQDSVIVPVRSMQYRYFSDPFAKQLYNNFGNGIAFSISVPIFNGGAARTNLLRAKLNEKTYELQQQQDNMTLKQEIYKAYAEAVTSLQKFNATSKSLEAAQKATDFTIKRYNLGLVNLLELITLQNNLYSAKLQKILAQYEYTFKIKVLEFYKGQGIKM